MRKVYYNLARNAAIIGSLFAFCNTIAVLRAQQPPAPHDPLPQPPITMGSGSQSSSVRTASLESHEGLTISALPWTDPAKYKEKFPKKSPYSAGILAIHVSFRNDSDDSMRIGLSHIRLTIHLDSDNVQELQSLTPEEFAEAVLKPQKDPTATRKKIPLPVPVPSSGKGKTSDLQKQAQNAGIPTNVLAPHSTVEGLLYFDLRNQFDLLQTAHLYIPNIVLMQGNRALTYFDIDLSAGANP